MHGLDAKKNQNKPAWTDELSIVTYLPKEKIDWGWRDYCPGSPRLRLTS